MHGLGGFSELGATKPNSSSSGLSHADGFAAPFQEPSLPWPLHEELLSQSHSHSPPIHIALSLLPRLIHTTMQFFRKAEDSYEKVCQRIAGSANKSENRDSARDAKLSLQSVTWEDNGRSKGSCWGPCISDMTLGVDQYCMPLVRGSSNFEDVTWDVEMDRITLVVGNESGSELKKVTLTEYLRNFRSYLHDPSQCAGDATSLWVDGKDQHVMVSAQACMLPIPKDGTETKFHVQIRNYQSRPQRPAVLAIVASAAGTSAQILDGSVMSLWHNNNGQRAAFLAERLSAVRTRESPSSPKTKPKEMTDSEKERNILLVIQVPLKRPDSDMDTDTCDCSSDGDESDCEDEDGDGGDVEDALLKVGENEGPYTEMNGCTIERDERFPVRVTAQFYKATMDGKYTKEVWRGISAQLQGARTQAVAISSLVTENTNRTTEHTAH